MRKIIVSEMISLDRGSIVNELTALDLIDEYCFAVNPVLLGNGKTLFNKLKYKIKMKLLKVKTLDSGVVILYYRTKKNK